MKPRQHGRRRRSRIALEPELDLTAFLNMLVVLLPFLLTTAVFSRMAVIGVELPTAGPPPEAAQSSPSPPVPPFSLAVRLEAGAVVVRSGGAALAPIPRGPDGAYDTRRLGEVLAAIKAEHPGHDTVDLFARPNTPYAELVGVMDAASIGPDGRPLFADVRLGELRP